MSTSRFQTFPHQYLRQFCFHIFRQMGCSDADAKQAADVLLLADLRGIDSHGVARLSGYVRLWEKKRINPTPDIRIVHETASTATVDGDAGLGLVVAPKAMEIAINKAKEAGSGWVAIRNSNHFGIAAYHAMMAVPHNMIGFSVTNASPLVAPTHSTERMLGTNPICFAIPAGEERPFVADLATAAAANGKLEIAQRQGKPIPEGWVQTGDGSPSTDPHALKNGGSLLPLGSTVELGNHKGYALGSVVDILSGVLSGASFGPWAPPFVAFLDPLPNQPGQGLGHFVGAWRVDAFQPAENFKINMDRWIRRFRSATPKSAEEKVLIPGEPEFDTYQERMIKGIPVVDTVVRDLQELGRHMDVNFEI